MLEVRKVNEKFENCLNCGKPIDREVVIVYKPWYITPIQLCDECLAVALEKLVAEKKGEYDK